MWFYNLGIFFLGLAIKLASFKKAKAKLWVSGRENWRSIISAKILKLKADKIVWVHCSSYGEFEQGRPVVEAIKKQHPTTKIVLSFFSPSGYEAFKNWDGADIVCYMPLDTKQNAKDFIEIVNPGIAIFIKYEFWLNFLFQLKEKAVPTFLISAMFKPHQPFFKWYGGIFRKGLSAFTELLIQDENSAKLLETIGVKNYKIVGDTRFDRVLEVKQKFAPIPQIEGFKASNKLIIAGSTWPKDEDLILTTFFHLINSNVKLLLVPHDVEDNFIKETVRKLKQHNLTYSLFTDQQINNNAQVLVLNTIGLLSKTYFYANCAYIGGGFNGGLHNTLEAAVYGIPVTFYGNQYLNYNEAVGLVKLNAAKSANNADELLNIFTSFLTNEEFQHKVSEKLNVFFKENSNSTTKVLKSLKL